MTHTAQTWEKTVKENKYSWKRCGVFNTLVFELLVTKHGMEFTLKPFLKTTHEKKEHIVSTCCLPHSIFSQSQNTQS